MDDDQLLALAARAAALPDAPAQQIHAAISLWPRRPGALLRRIRAVLQLDSAVTPAGALGLRAAGDVRHLLYSAEGRDVDLRVQADVGGFSLQGQVLGPDEAGAMVLQPEPAGLERRAPLDDLGGFRFDSVQAGRYTLSLHTPGQQVDLPLLVVGDVPP